MCPNASRLMLTAFRMSSIDIRTSTPLRRASTPYTPMQNNAAPSSRNWLISTSVPSRQDDGADERSEEQQRHGLERHQVGAEDRVADGPGSALGGDRRVRGAFQRVELVLAEVVDEDPGEHADEE